MRLREPRVFAHECVEHFLRLVELASAMQRDREIEARGDMVGL